MIYAIHHTKSAPVLGALLSGQEGPFGRRPASEGDDAMGQGVEELAAAVPMPGDGSGQ
ncbi:hypothetical protein [Streptomyces sp. NPDC007172]|uniref:hypothetical protein n=1 Tax=Streptomyces sp. NPDC007172 TaxID=3364776 RepID=UPI0036805AE0